MIILSKLIGRTFSWSFRYSDRQDLNQRYEEQRGDVTEKVSQVVLLHLLDLFCYHLDELTSIHAVEKQNSWDPIDEY